MSLVHLLLFLLFLWLSSYVPKSDGRLARQGVLGEPHLVRSKQLDKPLPLWEAKVEAKPEAAFDSAFFAVDLRRIPILGQRMTSLSWISRVVSRAYLFAYWFLPISLSKEGMGLAVGF